jgi:hypothetical protein
MNKEFKSDFTEEQELIQRTKPYMRFKIGDTVFLKSDKEKQYPMTVKKRLNISFDEDYVINTFNQKGELNAHFMFDCALMPGD